MYLADLHIHSRYSMATSRDCIPEHLELCARRKGIAISVIGSFPEQAKLDEIAKYSHFTVQPITFGPDDTLVQAEVHKPSQTPRRRYR